MIQKKDSSFKRSWETINIGVFLIAFFSCLSCLATASTNIWKKTDISYRQYMGRKRADTEGYMLHDFIQMKLKNKQKKFTVITQNVVSTGGGGALALTGKGREGKFPG